MKTQKLLTGARVAKKSGVPRRTRGGVIAARGTSLAPGLRDIAYNLRLRETHIHSNNQY